MKRLLFLLAFSSATIFGYAQTIPKGSLLGVHKLTINLKDGVKLEDYTTFLKNKAIPAYEKAFVGMKIYLLRSLRGTDSSSVGMLIVMKNEAERNKFFKDDGSMTAEGDAAWAKLTDIEKEQQNYLTSNDIFSKYNDWLVE